MKTLGLAAAPRSDSEAEALIQEARRRQRRRRLVSFALAVAVAAGLGVFVGSQAGSDARRVQPQPRDATGGSGRKQVTGPVLSGIDTTVFLWPYGYQTGWGPGGGPPAYVDDLHTGRLSVRQINIAPGDFSPVLMSVARWLVYQTYGGASAPLDGGVAAIPDDLTGRPRVLGSGTFAPSATPDHVWLVTSGPCPTITRWCGPCRSATGSAVRQSPCPRERD